MEGRLSHEEFAGKPGYSGFNEAFEKYFPGDSRAEAANALSGEAGIVREMPYLPENTADETRKKMGLA